MQQSINILDTVIFNDMFRDACLRRVTKYIPASVDPSKDIPHAVRTFFLCAFVNENLLVKISFVQKLGSFNVFISPLYFLASIF